MASLPQPSCTFPVPSGVVECRLPPASSALPQCPLLAGTPRLKPTSTSAAERQRCVLCADTGRRHHRLLVLLSLLHRGPNIMFMQIAVAVATAPKRRSLPRWLPLTDDERRAASALHQRTSGFLAVCYRCRTAARVCRGRGWGSAWEEVRCVGGVISFRPPAIACTHLAPVVQRPYLGTMV